MDNKTFLSFRHSKALIYFVVSGLSFVLILIFVELINRGQIKEFVFLFLLFLGLIFFLLFILLKINKLNLIYFDEEYVYLNTDKQKININNVKSIRYYLLAASYISFENENKRYYFLVDKNELLFRKKRKKILEISSRPSSSAPQRVIK
ncbi:hypothetical protein [Aquimarina celericrescens]|uniref:YcxB-like protein domain-containing protein n=1 Tax=Aquimarina celericrescens TaxID=1964542 RepID=A0ABW5ASU0_9FLAO|nr:hypothetical protein [Aquimarina celericrescens]